MEETPDPGSDDAAPQPSPVKPGHEPAPISVKAGSYAMRTTPVFGTSKITAPFAFSPRLRVAESS